MGAGLAASVTGHHRPAPAGRQAPFGASGRGRGRAGKNLSECVDHMQKASDFAVFLAWRVRWLGDFVGLAISWAWRFRGRSNFHSILFE
jgi:hypothetical protein